MEGESLSVQMKESTKEIHAIVERTPIMVKIIGKSVTKEEYKRLLATYYHMYAALEDAIEKSKEDQVVRNVYFPTLYRANAIESDLAYFFGPKWRDEELVKNVPASTQAFVAHIQQLAQSAPHLLLPHIYVRYLGDLAGGQIMSRKLQEAFESPDGLAFYDFSNIENPRGFLRDFKEGIDKVVEPKLVKEVVQETQKAYELQHDILNELSK